MTVSHLYYDDVIFNSATNPSEESNYISDSRTFLSLLRVSSLCNKAIFEDEGNHATKNIPIARKNVIGDASEASLLKFTENEILKLYQMTTSQYRKNHKQIYAIPFNSVNKWQLSVHEIPHTIVASAANEIFIGDLKPITPISIGHDNQEEIEMAKKGKEKEIPPLLLIKGAPERIIEMCKYIMIEVFFSFSFKFLFFFLLFLKFFKNRARNCHSQEIGKQELKMQTRLWEHMVKE